MGRVPRMVRITCESCEAAGGGCSTCGGRGVVQAFCYWCGHVAEVVVGLTALCLGCALPCVICGEACTQQDAVPFGGVGYAHAFCALGYPAAGFLEAPVHTDDSGSTNERASERSLAGGSMPRPAPKLVRVMREQGYIHIKEAAKLSGHPVNTLYDWVAAKRLDGLRTGFYHFVSIASLKSIAPNAKIPPLEAA